jgi:predicted metalloprotease
MRWDRGSSNRNIDDRRGMSAGGGGGGFRMGGGMGLGGLVIMIILSLVFGRNVLDSGSGAAVPSQSTGEVGAPVQETAKEAETRDFVTYVLNNAQARWTQLLPQYFNTQYKDARLVLFRDAVDSGCGTAQSAMGPFYCPLDQRAYIDLGFYDELSSRFGAKGDFAQAYVLAHELGHHVQNLVGTSTRVRQLQESRPNDANALSVRLELQADCYAGVWAYGVKSEGRLDPGDAEEGLTAAAAVGDDRLQKQSGGGVHPESFTHGTSAQRMNWFKRGFENGDPRNCDTFAGGI